MLQKITHQFSNQPKQLFLIDGLGALLSAFFLGIVLVHFESYFGMPRKILYFLAVLPCFFAIYDFICYFKVDENWRFFLRIIAMTNLIYCAISIFFVFQHHESLTNLGRFYFLLELIIVLILVAIQLKTVAPAKQ